jgi:hypothetical protein
MPGDLPHTTIEDCITANQVKQSPLAAKCENQFVLCRDRAVASGRQRIKKLASFREISRKYCDLFNVSEWPVDKWANIAFFVFVVAPRLPESWRRTSKIA